MSARVVAVTSLLLDVLADLAPYEDCTPSETALANLLSQHGVDLRRIKDMATAEESIDAMCQVYNLHPAIRDQLLHEQCEYINDRAGVWGDEVEIQDWVKSVKGIPKDRVRITWSRVKSMWKAVRQDTQSRANASASGQGSEEALEETQCNAAMEKSRQ